MKQRSASNRDSSGAPVKEFLLCVGADSSVLADPASIGEICRMFCSLPSLLEEECDSSRAVSDLGVDSLVKIETRKWHRCHLDLDMSENLGNQQHAIFNKLGRFGDSVLLRRKAHITRKIEKDCRASRPESSLGVSPAWGVMNSLTALSGVGVVLFRMNYVIQ